MEEKLEKNESLAEAWAMRPRSDIGNKTPELIFQAVGQSLTVWERLEIELAELFDTLVASGNRTGFIAYREVISSQSRSQMLKAAAAFSLRQYPELNASTTAILAAVQGFAGRRNEIAHGIVFDLGEGGCFLAPSNLNTRKWDKEGIAKYQYVAKDIEYYSQKFGELIQTVSRTTAEARALFANAAAAQRRAESRYASSRESR